jgi:DNA-binding HxlR family transcriptional regulator
MSRGNSQEPENVNKKAAYAVVRGILGRIGDKWSFLVLTQLFEGPLRFLELQRAVSGVSRRMLTRTLRHLEREGLVSRTVHPTAPPQVEYAVTGLGRDLEKPLLGVVEWAEERAEDVLAARREYDGRKR